MADAENHVKRPLAAIDGDSPPPPPIAWLSTTLPMMASAATSGCISEEAAVELPPLMVSKPGLGFAAKEVVEGAPGIGAAKFT